MGVRPVPLARSENQRQADLAMYQVVRDEG